MLEEEQLRKLYVAEGNSMQEIAKKLGYSLNKVKYWMVRHSIPIRSIADAGYLKHNPNGDPFKVRKLVKGDDLFLFGLGLGLYWGEGTKANKGSIRLGNSDPYLIKKFMEFMDRMYGVKKSKLKFGLQVFSDTQPDLVRDFWQKHLKVLSSQFYKVIVTPSRGAGTYRKKVAHGVLTVYYNNRKLRDIICGELTKLGFKS